MEKYNNNQQDGRGGVDRSDSESFSILLEQKQSCG